MAAIPPRADFLTLWGVVRAAVENPELVGNRNRVTQYIYESYRQLYAARGEQPPGLTPFALNPLVSIAYQQRAAKRELGRAVARVRSSGRNEALTRAMRAPDVDVSPLAGFVRPEKLRARVGYSTTEETLPSRWVTRELDLGEVSSVAELLDMAEEYATATAADYGLDYDGLDSIELTFA